MKTLRQFINESMYRVEYTTTTPEGRAKHERHDVEAKSPEHAKRLTKKHLGSIKHKMWSVKSHDQIKADREESDRLTAARDAAIERRRAERSQEERDYLDSLQKRYDSSGPYRGD